jgi:hypothetical protein
MERIYVYHPSPAVCKFDRRAGAAVIFRQVMVSPLHEEDLEADD